MVYAFSFCLYGPENPLYYRGLLENIFLAGKYFPTWKVYIFLAPDVTTDMRNHLSACSTVVLKDTGITGSENMIHRFYAIDEPEVELMMVRDADSRIHWKDRWAIREFVSHTEFVAHTIRDNVQHTARMMGGLWGMRKSAGVSVRNEYQKYRNNPSDSGLGNDQNFLGNCIYPLVKSRLLVHYSNQRVFAGEHAVSFPFNWTNDVYCGRVEVNYYDIPDPIVPSKPKTILESLPRGFIHIYK